eukprot:867713-Amphidinium_carterae.1
MADILPCNFLSQLVTIFARDTKLTETNTTAEFVNGTGCLITDAAHLFIEHLQQQHQAARTSVPDYFPLYLKTRGSRNPVWNRPR